MRNIIAIARRELNAYFTSPIAYVAIAVYLVAMGIIFSLILHYSREATMRYTLSNGFTIFFLIVATVAFTMRLLAEEQRSGTIELLLTSPVRDWEVVVGKFLACVLLICVMLALTLYYPFLLFIFQGNPDIGPIISGYLGLFLLGASAASIGVFSSSLTKNQVVALIVGVVICLVLWFTQYLADVTSPPMQDFFAYLSILQHYPDFSRGIIDTKDVVYYLSLILASLFLATRSLETRRWR